jgi:CBS-domain-containing membrane protein
MGATGAIGLALQQPWLFPSLGPTIFLQAVTPSAPEARSWNIMAGHAIGVIAGFAALYLFGAQATPTVIGGASLCWERVAATALAVAATVGAQSAVSAQHPPAAATTMLITLGGLRPGWGGVLSIAAGVSLVATFGAIVQFWRPQTLGADKALRGNRSGEQN